MAVARRRHDVLPPVADAWLVIDSHGQRSVFIDRARAVEYAAAHHATVHALYLVRP